MCHKSHLQFIVDATWVIAMVPFTLTSLGTGYLMNFVTIEWWGNSYFEKLLLYAPSASRSIVLLWIKAPPGTPPSGMMHLHVTPTAGCGFKSQYSTQDQFFTPGGLCTNSIFNHSSKNPGLRHVRSVSLKIWSLILPISEFTTWQRGKHWLLYIFCYKYFTQC